MDTVSFRLSTEALTIIDKKVRQLTIITRGMKISRTAALELILKESSQGERK